MLSSAEIFKTAKKQSGVIYNAKAEKITTPGVA
jgi:hypothetical protein